MKLFLSFAGFMEKVLPLLTPRTSTVGASLLPAGTTAERPATGVQGYARYNATNGEFEGHNGAAWTPLGGGATGSSGDKVFFLNELVVDYDYTLPAGMNAGTFGPVTIKDGVTVTIPDGQTWSIV